MVVHVKLIHMMIDKYFLNLAGEYRVCSELLKRGIFATITYGNQKGADIYAIGTNRRAVVVEVNSSNINRFVTGFYQKYQSPSDEHPDFWVLYSVQQNDDEFVERFFILTHQEMAEAQAEKNSQGKNLTYEELVKQVARGVDNVLTKNVEEHELRWDKIIQYCNDTIER